MSNEKAKDAIIAIQNRMLESIINGTGDWVKPFAARPPTRACGTPYKGINRLILADQAVRQGYSSPRWMTFNAARKAGGMVRKGEKGAQIVFWKILKKKDQNGEEVNIPLLRYDTVFNLSQIEGLEDDQVFNADANHDEARKLLLEHCEKDGIDLVHYEGKACYFPSLHKIAMPMMADMTHNAEMEWTSTLAHEVMHSTGKALGRKTKDFKEEHGVPQNADYAFEELVAEFGAITFMAKFGLHETLTENSAAYLRHWVKAVSSDKSLWLMKAMGLADKAVDFVLKDSSEKEEVEDEAA